MVHMTDEELFKRLTAVTSYILNQPELLAEWTRDWWPFSAKLEVEEDSLPAFAVMPDSAAEISAILKVAAEAEREVILKGGGTSLVGAIESRPNAILIDLRGLNVIDAVNEIDHTVRVDAGVHGGELEERLNEQGYSLCHFPRSLNLSTVGGWIATRAVGAFATKYGGIEDLVQGLDIVLPDGQITSTAAIPRQTAGPRWLDLIPGSEGVYGIVTAVTLRVRPTPEERRFRAFSVPSFEGALESLRGIVQQGILPAAVALSDPGETESLAFDLNAPDAENLLILAFDGVLPVVDLEERLTAETLVSSGATDLGSGPGLIWFDHLFRCDWLIDGNEPEGAMADEIDVTTPWSNLAAVIEAGRGALTKHADEVWTHSNAVYPTGAMIGFTFFIRKESDDAAMVAYQLAWRDCLDAVITAGGGSSHHNGIGQVRLPWFTDQQGAGMQILRAVKTTLDPERRLNRGRLKL